MTGGGRAVWGGAGVHCSVFACCLLPFGSGLVAPACQLAQLAHRACLPATPPQYLRDVPLGAGEETSAEYNIFFPRQLPAREFVLKMSLVYTAGGQFRQAMFFNETINVIEEPTLFDTQLIGLYLMGLALLAAIRESWHSRARCGLLLPGPGPGAGPSSDAGGAAGGACLAAAHAQHTG